MYRIEVKDLGENSASVSKVMKHISYKEFIKEEHLSFSLPNDCTDGKEWGNIYSYDKPIGQILITFIEEWEEKKY